MYTSQTQPEEPPTTPVFKEISKQAKTSSPPTCGTATSESSRTPFCVRLYPLVETGERTSSYLTAPLIKQCSTERGKRTYGTQNTSLFRITSYIRYHRKFYTGSLKRINPLKPELNPTCYLLALLAHHFLNVSRIRVKSLTFRRLMSYIYMEHPFLMFLDHTRRRSTVGRTPLDE